MINRIILGTVQLGLPYGINNSSGKPDEKEAFDILNVAATGGLNLLDTADGYGNSLEVIGRYLKSAKNSFGVINKFTGDGEPLVGKVDRTLELTGCDQLYAYLFHRYVDYQSRNFIDQLLSLKRLGKIARIGVSLYSLSELETVINDASVDLIQLPLNPFDLSSAKQKMLETAKQAGKEIHVRSVFLQGLFFRNPGSLTGNLKEFESPLRQFNQIAVKYNMDNRSACLSFALKFPFVDRVLIGVETAEQLRMNLSALQEMPTPMLKEISAITIPDESLLNPSCWKP